MATLVERLNEAKLKKDFIYLDLKLEYIMSKYGAEALLDKLGIEYIPSDGEYLWGFCPDHYEHTGRYPSDPKWSINRYTGKTLCFTESRSSNIIEITKNIMNFSSLKQASDFLMGDDKLPSLIELQQNKKKRMHESIVKPKIYNPDENDSLNAVRELINSGLYNQECIEYFKKNDITEDTIKEFGIVSIEDGKLKDRVLIPFYDCYDIDKLIGYVAVDVLGKKKYVHNKVRQYIKFSGISSLSDIKKAIVQCKKYYKKALFCNGAPTVNHLFGLSNIVKRIGNTIPYVILVEGERDAIKLQQEGFNAVGTHGTHLSALQKDILHHYNVNTVYICFDGDEAGINAAKKVYNNIIDDFGRVENILLPIQKKDPKLYNSKEFLEILNQYNFNNSSNYWGGLFNKKSSSIMSKKVINNNVVKYANQQHERSTVLSRIKNKIIK